MTDAHHSAPIGVSTASLSDAVGRLCNHKASVLGLTSPTPKRILFGRAVTIRYAPFRSDLFDVAAHSFARFFYQAIGRNPTREVLVLDSGGQSEVSMGGGTKLSRLQNHRLAGLITDGRLRDFEQLAGYAPTFYCSGEAVRAGTGDVMPVASNEVVSLAGTPVAPGDFIYADSAGAVVIPATLIERAVALAQEIEAEDERFLATIREEDPDTIRRTGSGEV